MDRKWMMQRVSNHLYEFTCWGKFTDITETIQVRSDPNIDEPEKNSEYERIPEDLRILVDNVFLKVLADVIVIRAPKTILILRPLVYFTQEGFYEEMVKVFNDSLDGVRYLP